jgi:nitroreductase
VDTIEILGGRQSVGADFMAEPGPTDEDLKRILAVGLRVPDHGRMFPWRIQVLRKDAQRRLAGIYVARYKALHPDARQAELDKEERRPQRAPLLLVVSNRLVEGHKIPLLEQTLSGGALCMNVLNAAHALGYAANWVTGWPAYDPEIRRTLDVPEGSQIIGFIHIGSPGGPPRERPRPAMDEIVSDWTG